MFVILFCFVLTSILVFVPKDENKPLPEDPVAEIPEPVEPEPIGPVVEPDPVEPEPRLVSFSKKGEIRAEVGITSATIIGKVPEGTSIILDVDALLLERGWNRSDRPQEEYCLVAEVGSYGLFFLGIVPTKELSGQLAVTHIYGGPDYIQAPAGTLLGTVGRPLKNDWEEELEGCNFVIIVATWQETSYIIEPSVTSIIEAITR